MIKIRYDYTFLIFLLIPILKVLILSCLKKLLQRKNKNTNTNKKKIGKKVIIIIYSKTKEI